MRIDDRRIEPRFCHAVRLPDLVVGNLHATNDFQQPEVPAAEILRAEAFVTESLAACRASSRATSTCEPSTYASSRAGRPSGPGSTTCSCAARGEAADRVAARAARHGRRRPLRSRAGRGDRRMTPEEARALFPVLERVAYLNAGTFGPLARRRSTRCRPSCWPTASAGGRAWPTSSASLELRAQAARAAGGARRRRAGQVALTSSTTDGCNIVLAGLDLGPEDEVVTTTDEHFGLLGPLHASGARVVVAEPDPDAILAAVTPRTRLLAVSHVALDERPRAAGAGAAGAERRAGARRRRAVGRRDPGRRGRPRLLHGLRPEVALRPGLDRRARRRRPRAAAGRAAELLLAGLARARRRVRAARGRRALRAELALGELRSPACSRRSTSPPEWRFERAAEQTRPVPRAARAARRGRPR